MLCTYIGLDKVWHSAVVELSLIHILPQQLEMMRKQTAGLPGAERIHGHGANLLDREDVYKRQPKVWPK